MNLQEALPRRVRIIRRWLSKRLDPKPEPDTAWDIPIRVGLRATQELRDLLDISEESYLHIAGQSFADARGYILYSALDEVQKAAMYLMRQQEFVQGRQLSARAGQLDRVLLTHVLEERDSRARRLLELLVLLVLFSTTNEQPYYKHFLLLEELDDYLSANDDLEEFYDHRSGNIDDSLQRQVLAIRDAEEQLDLSRCWYLAKRSPLTNPRKLRPGRLLSSMRARIKAGLPVMRSNEKLLFGFTYGASYGLTSGSVHYVPNRRDFALQDGEEKSISTGLGLLMFSVIDRCHELLGRPDAPTVNRMVGMLSRNDPTALVSLVTASQIEVGDFVLAYGDLAEVVEVRSSSYGYRSYRVRYLAEKPKPNVHEDWFPALYVQRFYTRATFFTHLRKMASEGKIPPDMPDQMSALPSAELGQMLRDSMTNSWNVGLRDWVRARRRPKPD